MDSFFTFLPVLGGFFYITCSKNTDFFHNNFLIHSHAELLISSNTSKQLIFFLCKNSCIYIKKEFLHKNS